MPLEPGNEIQPLRRVAKLCLLAFLLLAGMGWLSPLLGTEVVFVTDERDALVSASARGEPAHVMYATEPASGGKWKCRMPLTDGKAYVIEVTSGGLRASGNVSIVPYAEMPELNYLFSLNQRQNGYVSRKVDAGTVSTLRELGEAGGEEGNDFSWILLVLVLGLAMLLSLSFIIWFARRVSPNLYEVGITAIPPPDEWPLEIRESFPYLTPVGKLASGGLASVYLVQDARYGGSYLALKVLHEQFCKDGDIDLKARFLDEPTIMRHLSVTGYVPQVYGCCNARFVRPWFEMEYLDGMVSLRQVVGRKAQQPLDKSWAIPVIFVVTRAMRSIHAVGAIHRDLSPENVMLSLNGGIQIKIIDFGGAKFRGRTFSRNDFFHSITIPGQQMGKIHYTAPELWKEGIQAADFRSDGYSIAVMFWEIVMGQPPFAGKIAGQIRQNQAHGRFSPAALTREGVPVNVASLICAMLSPERDRRPSMEMLEAGLSEHVV
jgi:tRNA A-37 threonylcarbamoyl transferase component Bud32